MGFFSKLCGVMGNLSVHRLRHWSSCLWWRRVVSLHHTWLSPIYSLFFFFYELEPGKGIPVVLTSTVPSPTLSSRCSNLIDISRSLTQQESVWSLSSLFLTLFLCPCESTRSLSNYIIYYYIYIIFEINFSSRVLQVNIYLARTWMFHSWHF